MDPSLLGRYERGDGLSRVKLDTQIAPLGYPPEAVDVLVFADRLISGEGVASTPALSPEESGRIARASIAAGWTAAEVVYSELLRRKKAEKAEAAGREAEELWARLKVAPEEDQRVLATGFPEFWRPALARKVSHASIRAAAHSTGEALKLADLALSIAERVPGDETLRCQGYCWAHVGNARRVATDFDGANAAFARAWEIWRAGIETDSDLFPEWRLLDLEASLRREQHRFPEALALLDQARTACGGQPLAVGRVLLKREHVFNAMGDTQAALATLAEAAPFVEASGDRRLLFSLRFNMADDLCHLERYKEAAGLLGEVRALASEQAPALLNLTRVSWLAARIDAGLGRKESAVAGLERVRWDFLDQELPYEAALASLDLAVLRLKGGGTEEVRELAAEMEAVFRAKKIDREALAALTLFWQAAEQELVTVELALRVIAEIEKVRRSASRKA
jgi:tetratricopeptide (TPR) repeat protein